MPKVIQIRDVPDDVHEALARVAATHGLSLSGYLRRELEHVARRSEVVRDNATVVRRTQRQVGGGVDRAAILAALHDGRRE